MKKTKFFAALLAIITIFSLAAPFAGAIDDVPEVSAKRVLIAEVDSGEVVYELNADEQVSVASLTKIMTALIVLEEANLDDIATVSYSALDSLHPDSSIADLKPLEQMSVENLLKCMLIPSGNDAGNVLAEHLYGSVEKFVERMNERAKELGLENTQFKNPHGLTEEGHYSSARDMCKITLEAMKYPLFMEICNTARVEIPATNKNDAKVFLSTNYLISAQKVPDYVYYYAKGIKTGHTSAAGYCLVSTAEKDDVLYLCVVLGAERDEETSRIGSFDDTVALYEWAFDNFSYQTMLAKNSAVTEIPVSLSSEVDYVTLVPDGTVEALLPNDFDPEEVELKLNLDYPDGIVAPVERGQVLGSATVVWNNREYGEVELVALGEAKLDKTLLYIERTQEFFSQPWVMWVLIALAALLVGYIIFVIILNAVRRRDRRRNSRSGYRGNRRKR